MLQESRETLFRLQRMAGFESQNFDPQVSCHLKILILRYHVISQQAHACGHIDWTHVTSHGILTRLKQLPLNQHQSSCSACAYAMRISSFQLL